MKKFILAVFIPTIAFAQFNLANSTFADIVMEVLSIVDMVYPILIMLSFVVFFWGLGRFLLNSNSEKEIQNGKSYMFWGVIALFVLMAFSAILSYIANGLLGIGPGNLDQSSATFLLPQQ